MLRPFIILLLIAVITSFQLNAQNQPALWSQYYQDLHLKGRFHLMSDFSLRSMDIEQMPSILQVRTGLGFEIKPKKIAIETGIWYSNDYRKNQSEIRPHWQITFGKAFNQSKLYFRWRNEHRFLNVEDAHNYVLRSRLFAGFRFDLNDPTKHKTNLFAGTEQELLLNLQNNPKTLDLDQYRMIQYLGIKCSPSIEFSVNYFMLYKQNPIEDFSAFKSIIWLKMRHIITSKKEK